MTTQSDLTTLNGDLTTAASAATTCFNQIKAGTPSSWAAVATMYAIANAQKAEAAVQSDITPPPPPPPTPLTLAAIANESGTAGSPIASIGLVALGGAAPYAFKATGLPAGVALLNATISGTPAAAGTSTITVTVTDSETPAASLSETFTLTVAPAAPPPTAKIIMGAFADGTVSGTASALTSIGANPATSYMSAYWGSGGTSNSWANFQSQALSVISNLKGHPGKRLASIGLGPHALASMWSDMINSVPAAVSAVEAVAAALVAAGADMRTEWEYNSGTQSWATSPMQADFNAAFKFWSMYLLAAAEAAKAATPLLIFNPNDGVAINDDYAGQTPYTKWFTPGAVSGIFTDVYTGPNPSFPGGAAPCNGAPISNFISGPHVNWNDQETLALANGVAVIGIGELGAEGTGYDCAADVTALWNRALQSTAKGLTVILIVWCSGSWSEATHPNMLAQLKTLVTAGRANGTVA